MRALTILLCLIILPAFAGLLKIRTHRSANSGEFRSGLTNDWPQVEATVPDDYKLSADEIADGWELMSEEQRDARFATNRAAVESWLNANDPLKKIGRVWTKREFRARTTPAEWAAFKASQHSTNPAIVAVAEAAWDAWVEVGEIDENNAETLQFLGALSAIGVIDPDRIAVILHGP